MTLCNEDCMPCCDFCLYSAHESVYFDGKLIDGGPIGCIKHPDAEHQEIAESCGHCDDFYCFMAKD